MELKADAFKPGHAGQLNFYLAAVDAQIKAPDDNPTIGLLLCKTRNPLVAEYALSGIGKPIHLHPNSVSLRLPRHSDSDDGPAQHRANRRQAGTDRGGRIVIQFDAKSPAYVCYLGPYRSRLISSDLSRSSPVGYQLAVS